jgi:nucleoside-diphosphate-sugar epimerase
MQARRVLITGGAGFLGINLARYLLARGYAVTVLDLEDFAYPERERVVAIRGDVRDEAVVRRAAAGAYAIVHAAAALPLCPADDIHDIDVVGTRNVAHAATECGAERLVHISSTAVYGVPDHHPLVEDDRLQGVGPYGQAKIQAEMVCLEQRARGLVLPILRPKSFVGPERLGVFAMLYQWALEGRDFPVLGRGDNRYQLLDVEDLCQAIELALSRDAEVVNDTFNIGAKEFSTVRDDFQAVLDRADLGGHTVSVPAAPAIAALRVLERLHLSPLYAWVYETVTHDSFVSIERAERRLGFRPTHSNRDALVRNFDWYVANRHSIARATGVTHRTRWRQGALDVIKHAF